MPSASGAKARKPETIWSTGREGNKQVPNESDKTVAQRVVSAPVAKSK
jgi:hypothetical protein